MGPEPKVLDLRKFTEASPYIYHLDHAKNELRISTPVSKRAFPNMKENQAYYVFLEDVVRLYHVPSFQQHQDYMALKLGNSYKVDSKLPEMKPVWFRGDYAYQPLSNFGFVQVSPGVLALLPKQKSA
jgi:hypothetical protein